MKWPLAILAWLGVTAALAPICVFSVMTLAGPHGGILPEFFHRPVLFAAWALILAVPAWVAYRVYRRSVLRERDDPRE